MVVQQNTVDGCWKYFMLCSEIILTTRVSRDGITYKSERSSAFYTFSISNNASQKQGVF